MRVTLGNGPGDLLGPGGPREHMLELESDRLRVVELAGRVAPCPVSAPLEITPCLIGKATSEQGDLRARTEQLSHRGDLVPMLPQVEVAQHEFAPPGGQPFEAVA